MNDELNFTADELFAELKEQLNFEHKQPGDLTKHEIADHFCISEGTVRNHMRPLVASGAWKEVRVLHNDRQVTAYRKIKGE